MKPGQAADNILAVIPAYNEAAQIANVVTGVLFYLPVLVVDDGSTDFTAAQAKTAGAAVVRQQPNQGKGTALRLGLRQAFETGYEAVVTLDADGQHDPAEIPKFLRVYRRRQADLIIGARSFEQMPLLRRLGNRLGRWGFSWIVGQPIPDNQSGYRLISRRLGEVLLSSQEQGFEFEVEMITTCLRRNFVLAWVPVRTIYGGEQSHINPLAHVANFARMLWQTHQSLRAERDGEVKV